MKKNYCNRKFFCWIFYSSCCGWYTCTAQVVLVGIPLKYNENFLNLSLKIYERISRYF